ncbi:methyltransferase domain-containing protein [Thermoanaerobacterium sp. RBIITD]|uniref:methyltransferase domain-containing protein n=1 Tax=Thermoanaerobacterium sp. RBIITD TaxID=1550240 RepID=UPI000BB977B0|nr:methyltransferase domain-containing protein [Thermoanaerobacterium sp. RBIITD]SNX54270.1 Methyltransferase domain-containing protein [Thermoanaerobacterium sp. RBIITD]
MNIKENIISRYEKLANDEDNLSCGGKNITLAELKEGENVLDLGCGRGNDVLNAAQIIGENGVAVGLDLTKKMIDEAEKSRMNHNIKNAEFIVGDVENIPLPDDKFDAVISDCVINHAKDKEKVYREIHRVLKDGGRFIVSDVVSIDKLPDEIINDPNAWADCFGGAIPEEDYIKAIKNAGFREVQYLKRREYKKEGYLVASITIKGIKK